MINMAKNDVLDHVMEIVEAAAERGEHDQEYWGKRTACGTSHCFAGWAAVASGLPLNWVTDWEYAYDDNGEFIRDEHGAVVVETFDVLNAVTLPTDEKQDIEDFAREYLGLGFRQASALFYVSESLEQVRSVVAQIKAGVAIPEVA